MVETFLKNDTKKSETSLSPEKRELRENAKSALLEAIEIIKDIPEEKRTDREGWILRTIEESLQKADEKGRIKVGGEDGFGSGEKKFIKYEGIPIDELLNYLKGKVDTSALERIYEKANNDWEARKNFDDGKSAEEKKKGAWYSCFLSLNNRGSGLEIDLINEAEERVKKWEEMDGKVYQGMEKTNQQGEALFQIVKERLEERNNLSEEEMSHLKDIISILEKNSKPFENNNNEERDERIKLEGYYIDQEKGYQRKVDPEGNYYNGEKDLERRRELFFEDEEGVFRREAKISSVDELVKRMARRQADERLAELLQKPEEGMTSSSRLKSILNNLVAPLRHPKQFVQKFWVRLAEEGYRKKFYKEALEQITKNQNLMVELEKNYRIGAPTGVVDANARKDAHFALLDKVIAEYSDRAVELEEMGSGTVDPKVDAEMKKFFYSCLLSSKAKGGMQRDLFEKMQRGWMQKMKNKGIIKEENFLGEENVRSGLRNVDEIKDGRMYASNLYQIFQDYQVHIKNSLEQIGLEGEKKGEKLNKEQKEKLVQHVDGTLALDVELGAKLADIYNRRPENNFSWTDKLVGKMQELPILRRIAPNPGSMAILGAAAGNFFSRSALRKGVLLAGGATGLVTGAWLPIFTGAVAAGAFGALRRNKELKQDRAMHQRQRTEGREYENRFRRENMERFQYDVKSTTELDADLEGVIKATADNGGQYNFLPNEQKEILADIFARYKVELMRDRDRRLGAGNHTVDLIVAANSEEGERNNTHYLSKTDLKIKLYHFLEQQSLIDEQRKPKDSFDFANLFREKVAYLVDNIETADKEFDKYRYCSAGMTGILAGLSGAVGVFAGQAVLGKLMGGERYTALDSLKDLFKDKGAKKIEEFFPAIAFGGKKLVPGMQEIDFQGEKFKIFVDPKTGTTIDMNKSQLPAGWKLKVPQGGGLNLVHEIASKNTKLVPAKDWDEFVQKNGWNNDQRVSYHKFNYQLTAPEKGVRALPETVENYLNNLRLKANSTELMMRFFSDKSGNGDVLVDVSRMLKEVVKGGSKDAGFIPQEVVKKGGKFFLALSESNNASQHNPILLPMDEKGMIRVPAKLAKTFFAFDEKGNLIEKNPGQGMKSFIFDTGLRRPKDGAMIAEGISNRLGVKPQELLVPKEEIIKKEEVFPFNFKEGKEAEIPWAVGPAGVSRWQLEEEEKTNQTDRVNEDKRNRERRENGEVDGEEIIDVEGEEITGENVFDRPFQMGNDVDAVEVKEENENGAGEIDSARGEDKKEIQPEEAINENLPENRRWQEFKKKIPNWSTVNKYLLELGFTEALQESKKDRLKKAIKFLKSFCGFSGALQPTDDRRQFNNFVRLFQKETKDNLTSERDLAKFFSRLLEEEAQKIPASAVPEATATVNA